MDYEHKVYYECLRWQRKMVKKQSMLQSISKKAQNKVNNMIPEKIHQMITESIQKMVEGILVGSQYITNETSSLNLSLEQKEQLINKRLQNYKRTAAIEGASTGAGGLFLGLADFPLLLSIKVKFMFDTACLYGFDFHKYEERIYILYLFQLAFSSNEMKKKTFQILKEWQDHKGRLKTIDWRIFQQEYRDYLDLAKLLQLVPGVGAFVGAYANYHLLDHLGEVTMNGYRMRIFEDFKFEW